MLAHTPLARRLAGVTVAIAKRDQQRDHGRKPGESKGLTGRIAICVGGSADKHARRA